MQETTHEAYMNMTMTLLPRGASLAACTVIAAAVLFAAFPAEAGNASSKNSSVSVRLTMEAVLKHHAGLAALQEKAGENADDNSGNNEEKPRRAGGRAWMRKPTSAWAP